MICQAKTYYPGWFQRNNFYSCDNPSKKKVIILFWRSKDKWKFPILFKSNSKQFLKLYRIKITFVNVADSFSLHSNFKLRIGGRIKDKWVYQLLLGDYINISTYGFLIKSRGPMLKLMDPMSSAIKLIKHLVHEKRYVWLISEEVYLLDMWNMSNLFYIQTQWQIYRLPFLTTVMNGYAFKKGGGGGDCLEERGGGVVNE